MRANGPSAADKSAVRVACQQLIDDFLKPGFLFTIRPTQFNYPVDILGKWHGTKYRFIQRYRSGFPENLGEEFGAPFARLGLDQPQSLRHPVAPSHRRMVLSPSWPIDLGSFYRKPSILTHGVNIHQTPLFCRIETQSSPSSPQPSARPWIF